MQRQNAAVNSGWHQTKFDGPCSLACRSGAVCSANCEGCQAQCGGDGHGRRPIPGGQAERTAPSSAEASAMEAERVRRHRRLDAQHDSATRHRRGRTYAFNADAQGFVEPGMCRCPSPHPRTRRTDFTHLRETTGPTIRRSGFVPKHGYGCTVPRDSVLRQSAIQCMNLKTAVTRSLGSLYEWSKAAGRSV